ncbi:MAG: 3-methyl-2-oxobutanoate hydroxymethyltransferase [Pleurocapsa minor GSE-CHR-MK-17-07R]|jgi:3-methyl-2-oxobutanoate hydroxymethyltransferase|nr:3-methyl-2-oxobutanoate hydroxymethyltransferase [Pleurocapsa minor GSE-CHR-MK 17-07R]
MRMSVRDFQKMKHDGVPITMITAYDATSARLSEMAGIPAMLVGDSLGMVMQGHDVTIPVTLDDIIYHARIVTRVTSKAFVAGDLPFMTYTISPEQAMHSAARLMQEAGVSAVKLEGGESIAPTIKRLVEAGIPVMGHIGLQPQSVYKLGGMKAQGRDLESARQLLADAEAVEQAGAFAMVIEAVPAALAQMISQRLEIPTIGIGAGVHCDGQVQIFHDLLGLFEEFVPRHTRRYATLADTARGALSAYRTDVESRAFPTDEQSFSIREEVMTELRKAD